MIETVLLKKKTQTLCFIDEWKITTNILKKVVFGALIFEKVLEEKNVGREECRKINAFIEWIECANNFNLVQL